MPKFFILPKDISSDQAIIRGGDAHHIRRVLRLKANDEITINCQGRDLLARIETISPSEVRLRIMEHLPSPFQNKNSLVLVQGIPKHSTMDLILQKSTELGVEEIMPLASSRSFVNEQRTVSEGRWQRWQKICQEAAKQCGRSTVPKLHHPLDLPAVCSQVVKENRILPLLLWEKAQQSPLKSILAGRRRVHGREEEEDRESGTREGNKIFILVGPEGSFSGDEIQMAIQAGFIPVSCAPWILRAETAALYALSIIQYEFNFP
ncbi:MAG: RsmE family RNA methyltransferase [bacterium]